MIVSWAMDQPRDEEQKGALMDLLSVDIIFPLMTLWKKMSVTINTAAGGTIYKLGEYECVEESFTQFQS